MAIDQNPDFPINQLAGEIQFYTSRSSGPGGQHVNKTETRVELRWNIARSSFFTEEEKDTLTNKLAGKITQDGDLRVVCQESRSQEKNKQIAFQKFLELLKKSLQAEKQRKPTRPSKAVKEKRISDKKKHSEKKYRRKSPEV
jgi:ribosome-associated protein